jgi:hypothetical protein
MTPAEVLYNGATFDYWSIDNQTWIKHCFDLTQISNNDWETFSDQDKMRLYNDYSNQIKNRKRLRRRALRR